MNRIKQQIDKSLQELKDSEMMEHISSVETMAHVHGGAGYHGETIYKMLERVQHDLLRVVKEEIEKELDKTFPILGLETGEGMVRAFIEHIKDTLLDIKD